MSSLKESAAFFSSMIGAIAGGVTLAVVVIGLMFFIYVEVTSISVTDSMSGYLGTLGDFVGGLLNPVFAMISVVLLAYTLHQNSVALNLTGAEISRQAAAAEDSAESSKKQIELLTQQLMNEQKRIKNEHFLRSYASVSERINAYYIRPCLKGSRPDKSISIEALLIDVNVFNKQVKLFSFDDGHRDLKLFISALYRVVLALGMQVGLIYDHAASEYKGIQKQFVREHGYILYEANLSIVELVRLINAIDYPYIILGDDADFKNIKHLDVSLNTMLDDLNKSQDLLEEIYTFALG